MTQPRLKWGILGTGTIARIFAYGVQTSRTGALTAVGSRSQTSADAFAKSWGIPHPHASYEQLLADQTVEAVYIATPHPMHVAWAIKAAEAGKHVLCEKPAALNLPQTQAMIQAARAHGVFFMEAFMYRCHPQTAKLIGLIRSDVIGPIRMIRAAFGYNAGDPADNPQGRVFSPQLGGGGILDVGAYPVSMARLLAGVAQNKPFANPTDVKAVGHRGGTGVDEWAAAVLLFDSGIVAQVATAVRANPDNTVDVIGAKGSIHVPAPWTVDGQTPGEVRIQVNTPDGSQTIEAACDQTAYAFEADTVAQAIRAGRHEALSPAMSWDDTLGNMGVLDRWRRAVGLTYPAETPAGQGATTITGQPLARRADTRMPYARIDGLDKDISRLVMGCDNQADYAHGAALWDDWFERGGNAFDTAHIYQDGQPEKHLGSWLAARGVRDQAVLLVKGAHTPCCDPTSLTAQLVESLDRLKTDHADLYLMHRDNPNVPVGEFIDVLNEHADAGRMTCFGVSNWSLDRITEANAYAHTHGKRGLAALSNNLSLAEMVRPVWPGCIHVSAPASRQWLADRQMPLFAWSSQGRGYFLPETLRMRLGSDNFAAWDSPDNQARRERAQAMARHKGVSPVNIAAAYVLSQPFPSFALIGPRSVAETATCLPALGLTLTPDEIDGLWGSA